MYDKLIQVKTDIPAGPGKLLISEPMMQDRSFQKTVVLLTHHEPAESMGFVLNKDAEQDLSAFIAELEGFSFPLYIGGPVGNNSLQFIHTRPELLGGQCIHEDIYWNGDFQLAFEYIKKGNISSADCRFFMGFSGWGENQLQDELDSNSWLVAHCSDELLFHTEAASLWGNAIRSLGVNFKPLLFVPESPELN